METEENPLKSWLRGYFRAFIKAAPENLKVGDKLTFGVRYMDKDGNWGPIIGRTEVTKDELKDE